MGDLVVHHVDHAQKARLLEEFAAVLAGRERVAFALLFGSLAEREHVRDIDIGVYVTATPAELPGGSWRFEAALAEELESAVERTLGRPVPVDVRVMNEAPLPAQYAVLTGEIVYIGDPHGFSRVVEHVVPRYLDLRPLRDQALREVLSS